MIESQRIIAQIFLVVRIRIKNVVHFETCETKGCSELDCFFFSYYILFCYLFFMGVLFFIFMGLYFFDFLFCFLNLSG